MKKNVFFALLISILAAFQASSSFAGDENFLNTPGANFLLSKNAHGSRPAVSGLSGKIADLQGEWVNTDHPSSSVSIKGDKISFVYENQTVEYDSFSIYDGCPEHDDNAVTSKEGDTIYIKDSSECYVFYTDGDMMALEYQGGRLEHSTYRRKTNRNISKSPGRRYDKISNAAIKGYNDEQLSGVSVQDCRSACDKRPWCKSFDYYKYKAKCDLSSKSYHEVGLKRNYSGNPYDHYIKK